MHVAGRAGESALARGAGEDRADRRRRVAGAVLAGLALVAVLAAVAGPEGRRGEAVTVAAVALAVAVAARPRGAGRRWAAGAAGERATAAVLDGLPRSWAVLHDRGIPGSRANIDHLVVGRRRVWVVDSKLIASERSARSFRRLVGRFVDTVPVVFEARAAADRLGLAVWPVIALHGGTHRRRRPIVVDGVTIVAAHRLPAVLRRGDRRRWSGPGAGRRTAREVRRLAEHAERELPAAGNMHGAPQPGRGPRRAR